MQFSEAICDRANNIISPGKGCALTRFRGECLALEYPDKSSISALQYLSSFKFQTETLEDIKARKESLFLSETVEKVEQGITEWVSSAKAHLQALGITDDTTAALWMDELQPRLQQWHKEMRGLDAEVGAKVAALAGKYN